MATQAPKLYYTQDIIPHVYGISIALFVIMGVYSSYSCLILDQYSECSTFTLFFHLLGLTTIFALSLTSIILLAKNLGNFANIDIDGVMAFVKEEQCSEGPLQVSL
jgi:hypothetical protein